MQTTNFLLKKTEKFSLILMALFFSVITFAQDKAADLTVDVKTTETSSSSTEWFSNPLYWVIGGLILVVLIAVVARGGGKRD